MWVLAGFSYCKIIIIILNRSISEAAHCSLLFVLKILKSINNSNYIVQFLFPDSWEKNWVYSKHPGKEFGAFVRTAGKFYNDEEQDKGKISFN